LHNESLQMILISIKIYGWYWI